MIALSAAAALLAVVTWVLPRSPTAAAGATIRITNLPGLEIDPAISPDGKFVAYAAGPIGRMRIFVRQLAGGRTVGLTDSLPGSHRLPRWSADGTRLSFLAEGTLQLIPALGGSPVHVFDLPPYQASEGDYLPSPAISPDGKWVTYATPTAVYAQALEAGQPISIAQARLPDGPVWSPDGRRVAYVSGNPWFVYGTASMGNLAPSVIWVADAQCARTRSQCPPPIQVTGAQHLSTSPVWTPDGRAVLFVSDAGGYRDIYEQRLTAAGKPDGPAVRLTTGLNAHTISLTADGARVAYSSLTSRSDIWSAPVSLKSPTSPSAAVRITDENQSVEGVSLSPDGRWLAYDSNRSGRQQIFKVPVSGGEPVPLTRDSTDNFLPRWSPDGREIAYHSLRGGNRDLVTITVDGRNQRRATSLPGHEFIPDWSPDGRQLVFMSDLSGRLELYVIARRPDGWSAPRQITSGGVAYGPRWSPDGASIAYSAVDRTLRIISPSGGASRLALDGRPRGYVRLQADWGRNPDTLFCHVVDRESRHEFWAIPLRGGAPRLVLRFEDLTRQPRRTDFDTDGKRLYLTVASDESDVYVLELKRR